MWLFLAVPWVYLQFVIVVFLDHTHLLSLLHQTKLNKTSITQDEPLSLFNLDLYVLGHDTSIKVNKKSKIGNRYNQVTHHT